MCEFSTHHGMTALYQSADSIGLPCVSFNKLKWSGLRQMRHPWPTDHTASATLPMALLTSIVRKEALLPELTAAFAATQLLPVVMAATQRHLASAPGQPYPLRLCKELLVCARADTHQCCCKRAHDWLKPMRSCMESDAVHIA